MRLERLLDGVEVTETQGNVDVDVRSVTYASEAVEPGGLFCCVRGTRRDGHEFAADAVARGAVAVLGERLLDVTAPQVVVPETRPALAQVAAALHGHPSQALTVVGVTGTNGKTTTTYLLRAIFDAAGRRCGVIGSMSGERTTPEAPELQAELARLRDDGHAAVAMEVSSAALVARRVEATRFAAAVFTNLGHDHLGEVHASIDEYFAAKADLFVPGLADMAVINADDEWGRRLVETVTIPVTTFSATDATDVRVSRDGSRFRWRNEDVLLRVPGRFNIANALAAATTAAQLGVDTKTIAAGLGTIVTVPGHFEWVDAGQPFAVAVDYAHTPEALEHALLAARELAGERRVTVVFGCGGDRDPGKRGPMGALAARLADRAFVTSDNPRTEDPDAIIDAILAGAPDGGLVAEPDRARAIALAIAGAEPGDVVLIAGKGHETGQQIGDTYLPFDDRDVASQALRGVR